MYRFADDLYPYDRHLLIQYETKQPVYGDVDSDGAQETIVVIGCYWQGGGAQVVALDRDAAGSIVTMGTVIAMTGENPDLHEESVRVLPDGTVEVSVGDYQNCCGSDVPVQWQVRGYEWITDRFHQVSGPTSFPMNPGIPAGWPRWLRQERWSSRRSSGNAAPAPAAPANGRPARPGRTRRPRRPPGCGRAGRAWSAPG